MLRNVLLAIFLAGLAIEPSIQAAHGFPFATIPAPTHDSVEEGSSSGAAVFDVTGEVRLLGKGSSQNTKDASQVVIWLVGIDSPLPVLPVSLPRSARPHYRMLQRNKTFDPALLVVPLGAIVDFPNLDPWFHNVFSLYQGKKFDLGLYQAGTEKQVVFDRPGPSFLFCNIHPEMTAVVLTVDSDLFGVSDKNGRVLIPKVPGGRYQLHVWYENAESGFSDAAPRVVELSAAANVLPPVSVPVVRHDRIHKNKYGDDYDPKGSSLPY